MSPQTVTFIIAALAVNIIFLVLMSFSKIKKAYRTAKLRRELDHFGDDAEEKVSNYILAAFPGSVVLNNIYLKTEIGLTQIDHILICSRGIFIIETKSHNGYIKTGGKQWIQRYGDKTVKFHNPALQNEIHKKALEDTLRPYPNFAKFPITCVTVFTSKNVRFSEEVPGVIRLGYLNSFIKRRRVKRTLSKPTVKRIGEIIERGAEHSRIKQREHKNRIYKYNQKNRR